MNRTIENAFIHADALHRAGNYSGAIEPLRDVLTEDPEHAEAHQILANCLLQQRRITSAAYEAKMAVTLEPLNSDHRVILALVLNTQRKVKAAIEELEIAVELSPNNPSAYLLLSQIHRLSGQSKKAQKNLARAFELSPNDFDIIAEAGFAALERNDIEAVQSFAKDILSLAPSHASGLVLMGWAELHYGDLEEATRLALNALEYDAVDINALHLMVSIKARSNPLGAIWWRWNRFLIKIGEARSIFVVVGIWLVYRWLLLGIEHFTLPDYITYILILVYLMFVVYTISADVIIRKMIEKESERIKLKPNF